MKYDNLHWTMKTGESILIKDMDDRHLNNTIKFIEKALLEKPLLQRRLTVYKEAMQEELKKRFYNDLLKEKI